MDKILEELTSFISSFLANHPGCSKAEIAEAAASRFSLKKTRSVYYCSEFAIRFSAASGQSFSNVVLSLSALQKYDQSPFIVCIVRPTCIQFLLANSTFLKKISHSSHRLRVDNIRGSFLGHDIVREYNGIINSPENFDALFEIHNEFTWEENLYRLVDQTTAIVPTGQKFTPSKQQQQRILKSPMIASSLSKHPEYRQLYQDFDNIVRNKERDILKAAKIDNVNLRGNAIEQIVTAAGNFHKLEDISRTFSFGLEVKIDIKTKILNLSSSPAAYNIDKILKELAKGNVVFSFFFIGIDITAQEVKTCLVSMFEQTILNSTVVQFHWAGRNSRGVTQLTGDLSSIFSQDFSEIIDVPAAITFLSKLINL